MKKLLDCPPGVYELWGLTEGHFIIQMLGVIFKITNRTAYRFGD